MSISSMTGFGRAEGAFESEGGRWAWSWEIRSVNSRGLDMRCRLPNHLEGLEPEIRRLAGERFKRGALQVNLQISRDDAPTTVKVNETALAEVLSAIDLIKKHTEVETPRAENILALRGVMDLAEPEEGEEVRAERVAALTESLAKALDALAAARAEEGARMQTALLALVETIEGLTARARAAAEATPGAVLDKLKAQIAELAAATPVDEARLAQEAALLLVKADIREELDRLASHCAGARELLNEAGPVGRKLDFLTQEFNREANTLCAKASDMEIKSIGLELKTVIDQLREQIQNIE